MSSRPSRSVAAALALCVAAFAGCSDPGGTPQEPADPPAPSPTGLKSLDTEELVVTQASFCERLADDAPQRALGDEVADTMEYSPGDSVELLEGVTDVADEWSCVFHDADDGTTARAWLFAPPVTGARARTLLAGARVKSCSEIKGAAPFGSPSVALVCRSGKDRTISWRGLFGDAWLACSVSSREVGRAELRSRASVWCAEVARAASS